MFTESTVEKAALAWLEELGYKTAYGPSIAPDMSDAERISYNQVVLEDRLKRALWRLNPELPESALEDAFRKLTRPGLPSLVANNHLIHGFITEGVPAECRRRDGSIGRRVGESYGLC
jgi:type I restriction enzyme R subunit